MPATSPGKVNQSGSSRVSASITANPSRRKQSKAQNAYPQLKYVLVNFGQYVGFVTSELQLPVALGVLLLVLLVRPAGLLGRVVVRRV